MATVVNNPQPVSQDNGMGFLLGIIILIVFAIIFFVYLLPFIRSSFSPVVPQVSVPGKIDVNVKQK